MDTAIACVSLYEAGFNKVLRLFIGPSKSIFTLYSKYLRSSISASLSNYRTRSQQIEDGLWSVWCDLLDESMEPNAKSLCLAHKIQDVTVFCLLWTTGRGSRITVTVHLSSIQSADSTRPFRVYLYYACRTVSNILNTWNQSMFEGVYCIGFALMIITSEGELQCATYCKCTHSCASKRVPLRWWSAIHKTTKKKKIACQDPRETGVSDTAHFRSEAKAVHPQFDPRRKG